MSVLSEYQSTPMEELFPVDTIEDTLETDFVSVTPQQEAVLRFIVENQDEHYIELQNTFKMPDSLVMNLVIEYGTPSDQMSEMKELRDKMTE